MTKFQVCIPLRQTHCPNLLHHLRCLLLAPVAAAPRYRVIAKKNTPFPANLLVEDDLDLSSLGLSMANYSGSSFRGISINRFGTMPSGLETRGRYILISNMSQPASSSAAPAATQSRFVPVPEIFFLRGFSFDLPTSSFFI